MADRLAAAHTNALSGAEATSAGGTLTASAPATGDNWYVRPNGGSYGAENGTDWSNAFDGFSDINWAGVAAGDTVWIAGGSYTQNLNISDTDGTSGARIYVRRARSDATECTGAAGWSSAFDSEVLVTNQQLILSNCTYITVSGATTAAGGTRGWRFYCPGFTGEDYGSVYPNSSQCSIEWITLEGPGHVTYSGDSRGISLSAAGTANALTFTGVQVTKFTSAIFINSVDNVTFDRLDMSDCSAVNSASWHPNGIWSAGCVGLTVKNSRFHKGAEGYGCGEGIFSEQSGGNSDWKIYGCLFYDLEDTGTKCIEITSSTPNLKVFNNTFDNCLNVLYTSVGAASGTECRNNIFSRGGDSYGTASNNLTTTDAGIFVDRAGKDFHIVATTGAGYPRDAGTNVGSPYDVDVDGNTRGADGNWDIGAYEYTG